MTLLIENQDWASMPPLSEAHIWSTWSDATKTTPGEVNKEEAIWEYHGDLKKDWCIHSVPNGGYVIAIAIQTAQMHLATHPPSLDQPDIITFHAEFLNRTRTGPCLITIHPLKIGRQYSTIRAQILQTPTPSSSGSLSGNRKEYKLCTETLLTLGNLTQEALSIPSNPNLRSQPYILPSSIPKKEDCEEWVYMKEWIPRRPAATRAHYYMPKGSDSLMAHPREGPGVRETWLKWKTETDGGRGFGLGAVAFLGDALRPLVEAFGEEMKGNWYPTLSYGMDFRRKWKEGEDGWEWLFLRAELKECWGGRFGMDIVFADEHGDLVAVCRHTALIVGLERNLKGRIEDVSKI